MSARTFVSRTAALVALVALGAACETKTVVQPPPPPVVGVTVSPQSATLVTAGQTVQFVALVTGGDATTARTVTWASSNTAVATVDANGVAKAVANGTASIIATSTADATAKGAGLVTVNITNVQPPTQQPATVSIAAITNALGAPLPPSAIAGTILISANVDAPAGTGATAVNFQIDAKTVCSQTITAGKSTGDVVAQAANAVTFSCAVKTDSLVNGVPVFPNGAHTLTVSLAGTTATASQALTFVNIDALGVALSASKGPALDASGLAWVGGDVTVKVTPAIFSGSTNAVTSVTISVTGIDSTGASKTVSQAGTLSGGVFSATFSGTTKPSSNGLQGFQTSSLTASATSVTSAGNNGPGGSSASVRYDALAPAVSKFILPANASGATFPFLNGSFSFLSTGSSGNFGTTDNLNSVTGVDKVTTVLQFALAADTTANGGWTTITSVTQLNQVNTPAYLVRASVTDALGNTRFVYANNTGGSFTSIAAGNSLTFGGATAFAVDFAPPTITLNVGSLKTGTATTGALPALSVAASDTGAALSGVLGIQYKVIQYTASGATCLTKDSNGNCVFGTTSNTTTPALFASNFTAGGTSTTTTLSIPSPTGGAYDSVYVQTVDLAKNTSSAIGMMVLGGDNVAPTTGGLVGPAVVTGGSAASFSTQTADNLDLNKFSGIENFAAVLALDAGSTTVGTFGLPLETSASPSLTLSPFITSVETAAPAPAGSSTNVTSLTAQVTDQAGNASVTSTLTFTAGSNVSNEAAFTFSAPNTFPTPAQQAVASWLLTLANANPVCNGIPNAAGNVCGTAQTSIGLTATATGPTATFLNPFVRVNFYYFNGTSYTLIASTSAASATDNGTNRTWTFTTSWTPAGITAGAVNVIALGVDAKGHALMTAPVAVTVQNALQ